MKRNITNLISVIIFSIIAVGLAHSAEQSTFSVTKDNRIEAHANNLSLNEAVKSLASRFSLEVKGIGLSNEPINLDLSDITLEDLLKRLLRGYNYALVRPENADKGILMILGKADRTKYVDAPTPQQAAPPTAATTGTPGVQQGTPAATIVRPAQERRQQAGQRTATSPEAGPGAGGTGAAGTAATQMSPSQPRAAGQTSPGQTASGGDSLVPPMPPAIAGLDMPPMPPPMPAMSSAFGGSDSSQKTGVSAAGPSATGTVSSGAGQSSTQAGSPVPPATTYQPQGRGSSQSGTTPDLRPPQIPF